MSPRVRALLSPHLTLVHLQQREVLFRAHDDLRVAYFPGSAVVSLVSTLESGRTVAVGLIGHDGIVGPVIFAGAPNLPCDAIVQIEGSAWRIDADILRREVAASPALQVALADHAQDLLARCMQMSACNMFHSVAQRCARWLLSVSDLVGTDRLPVTHDVMATMLGVHRPTVTQVLRALDRAGVIAESRGVVALRDRVALGKVACECYAAMKRQRTPALEPAGADAERPRPPELMQAVGRLDD